MSKNKPTKAAPRRKVLFVFESPGSQNVFLVGTFNDWRKNRHPMENDGNGTWTKTVMLVPGTHEYKFLADNKWVHDPTNGSLIHNAFGTLNNIIEVK